MFDASPCHCSLNFVSFVEVQCYTVLDSIKVNVLMTFVLNSRRLFVPLLIDYCLDNVRIELMPYARASLLLMFYKEYCVFVFQKDSLVLYSC